MGLEYDLARNLIRGQNASGVWQKFEYDAAGRLKKVKDDSNNLIETYTYGATRERLITETSAGRTYYAWGGQSVIAEYTETSTTPAYSKGYVYAGSRLLMTATKASSSTETQEFHHPNRLGTELVTNGGAGTSMKLGDGLWESTQFNTRLQPEQIALGTLQIVLKHCETSNDVLCLQRDFLMLMIDYRSGRKRTNQKGGNVILDQG